jgi:hypothetical protein
MGTYWQAQNNGSADNIRLLTRDATWLAWNDHEPDDEAPNSKRIPGCRTAVNDALQSALHSTNVVILLGSGASFFAKNSSSQNAPGMADLWHGVRAGLPDNTRSTAEALFDRIALRILGKLPNVGQAGDIESLLSLCKMSIELLKARFPASPGAETPKELEELTDFVKSAEAKILRMVSFVGNETDLRAHTGFLQKFARRSADKPRVKLFTTNYDLCLETAAMRRGITLVDGFSHSLPQRFNRDHYHYDIVRRTPLGTKADFLEGVFQLYKLHGSVDWRRREDSVVVRSLDTPDDSLVPVLIYPRSTKYQEAFETPYLDMFSALQAALREPDTTLIISGFGFADDHISAPIWAAIEANLTLRLILCDCAFIPEIELESAEHSIPAAADGQRPVQAKLMHLVQQGDSRISILNGRFEDLADAMPMMAGKTDRQLLQDRLERVRIEGAA